MTRNQESFRHELQRLINSVSMENGSNTPDWVLADYLYKCLQNFDLAVNAREKWYGRAEGGHKSDSPPESGPPPCSCKQTCPCDYGPVEDEKGVYDDNYLNEEFDDKISGEELLDYAVDLGKKIWEVITNPPNNTTGPR